MARVGQSNIQFAGPESEGLRKDSSIFDVAMRRKEVLAAKSVVDEVRKRVIQLRGGQTKSDIERELEKEKEKEREKEEKLEKARAAAWAWYQHGKGGKESISSSSSSSGSSGISTITVRSSEPGHKSTRFKTEALKVPGHAFSSPVQSDTRGLESGHRLTESARSWDFSTVSVSRTSSLFDSYELDSVSKRIDTAFHSTEGSPLPTRLAGLTAFYPGIDTVNQDEWPQVVNPTTGLPPLRSSRKANPYIPQAFSVPHDRSQAISVPHDRSQAISVPHDRSQAVSVPHDRSQVVTGGSPKVTRSSSLRMQFPRCICSSTSDVVTHEEMALGVDIAKCECPKTPTNESGQTGWSLRKVSRAIQEFIHLPDAEYHPQQEHHERRHARFHLHHHIQHQHDHEFHLHYQIKLQDGVHHARRAFGRRVQRSYAWWCFL